MPLLIFFFFFLKKIEKSETYFEIQRKYYKIKQG